jgi:hypothetical protein
MESALAKLCRDIKTALVRHDAWELPLRRFRAENYRRLNQDGYTWEAYQAAAAELEAQLAAVDDPRRRLHPLFARLCAAYVGGDNAQRAAIRAFAAERKKLGQLLWRYANRLARQIQSPAEADLVTTALAAVAIDNCSANYRDTLMTLADLYAAAEAAGIDPRPLFAAAALTATDEATPGGCASLAAMMQGVHASSVLAERRALGEPYGGPI